MGSPAKYVVLAGRVVLIPGQTVLRGGSGYPLVVVVWSPVSSIRTSSEYSVNTLSKTPRVIKLSIVPSMLSCDRFSTMTCGVSIAINRTGGMLLTSLATSRLSSICRRKYGIVTNVVDHVRPSSVSTSTSAASASGLKLSSFAFSIHTRLIIVYIPNLTKNPAHKTGARFDSHAVPPNSVCPNQRDKPLCAL